MQMTLVDQMKQWIKLTESASTSASTTLTEGYTLKRISRDKEEIPPDEDEEYSDGPSESTTSTYSIVNNKTGAQVGTATVTGNNYFGYDSMELKMNNGATRWLDMRDKDPQAAFNSFVKQMRTSKRYKD